MSHIKYFLKRKSCIWGEGGEGDFVLFVLMNTINSLSQGIFYYLNLYLIIKVKFVLKKNINSGRGNKICR